MTGWFGESWGAPACDPEEHVATPVGKSCIGCDELIKAGDQGVTMPLVRLNLPAMMIAYHLDCYLKKIMPHTRECVRCRGIERDDHATYCQYRMLGGECNCINLEDV